MGQRTEKIGRALTSPAQFNICWQVMHRIFLDLKERRFPDRELWEEFDYQFDRLGKIIQVESMERRNDDAKD